MVLYFSGTGNSKYIAMALADKLSDEIMSINEIVKYSGEKIFESEKAYVIVSPIYAWRYPVIVESFLADAVFKGNSNVYCIATMGGNTGNCDKYVEKLINKKGLNFKGFRGVVMPNNYVIASVMESELVNDSIVAKAMIEVDEISAFIENGQVIHKNDKTKFAVLLSGPVHNMFTKHMHSSAKYVVNNECLFCGKCVELCVMNNVTIEQGKKPVFGKNCINCYACIQYCPKKAINIPGKTETNGRYTCKEYKSGTIFNI